MSQSNHAPNRNIEWGFGLGSLSLLQLVLETRHAVQVRAVQRSIHVSGDVESSTQHIAEIM
jgi:hypothetical protein